MVVDINKAAKETSSSAKKSPSADSKPTTPAAQSTTKRSGIPHLQHQASLSAQASAAVGAASEAGKFIANKITTEVNLKGAKEMVMAAASHLTGVGGVSSGPSSRIKFKNLEGEEDDDDFDDDDDDERRAINEVESTMDDEDDDDEFSRRARQQRLKKNKRGHSVISAALSSYKQKQGGYKKAANEDDFEDDDDEEEEDEDDEKMNLNRSVSFKNKKTSSDKTNNNEFNSSTDERLTPTSLIGDEISRSGGVKSGKKRTSSKKMSAKKLANQKLIQMKKGSGRYEEEEDDFDQESGRNYKCLDNSVALLIKTRFEETMLRIAVIAIVFVALGIFIIFSLPPTPPPAEVVDILIKSR